jgi:hypothetical protein
MIEHPFALSPIERVAIEAIREDWPQTLATFSAWVAEALGDLAQTSQGRVVTEAEADDLLVRFCGEAVSRMLADMAPWGVDEDLREPVVGLLVRHALAAARQPFVQRVVGTARN